MTEIGDAIATAVEYLTANPAEARYTDSVARATLGEALRVTVEGPDGESLTTDMPAGVGGKGEHPTPGWLFRAAMAACVADTVAMEAARRGVELISLQVEVDSRSDDRGILGMDPEVPAGPLSMSILIEAEGQGVDEARLRQVVEEGASRCPVCDATKRPVEVVTRVATKG
jgi:uncharacterized OsmC-like protein